MDWSFWTLALIAATLVGMAKGGLPMAGMLAVPLLSLKMSAVAAAGLLLPIYVVSDMFGLYAYRHAYDRRVLAILIPPALLGVGLGWATAHLVPEDWVTGLVGLIGTVFAFNLLARDLLRHPDRPARKPEVAPGILWGALTGFTSFVSHAGAPPYQVYVLPLRLQKEVFAGTTTILFAWVNAFKLPPYWALGQLNTGNLKLSLVLMAPAAAAVFLGVWLVKVLPDRLFFRLVTWSLLALSLKLVWGVI